MGFFKTTNLDWVKALIKEGTTNAAESNLLIRWATTPTDEYLDKTSFSSSKGNNGKKPKISCLRRKQ